jgi:dimethylglycine dehydrogenase
VIGGGIIGCSLLYHLSRLGAGDCLLVEKNELTAGTTWHSAACCTHFSSSPFLSALHLRTTRMYEGLEAKTGQPSGFHKVGSIRLAHDAEQMRECRRYTGMAKALGIAHELLTPIEVKRLYPLISLDGVIGALYTPDDGHVDPNMATQSFAIGARRGGAEINRHTKVVGLAQRPGGDWDVETDKGTITAGVVVNATGLWGAEIAALAGTSLPLVAIELQYLVTEAIPEIASLEAELPVLRGVDGPFYLRQERDGMLIGVYEEAPVFWATGGIPPDFGQDTLAEDVERVEKSVGAALARVPVLARTGIKNMLCGPTGRSPDTDGLMGPVPGLTNFFSHTGITGGFTHGPAASELMAQWIVNGQPDTDPWMFDLRRFGAFADRPYTYARVKESFMFGYAVHGPDHEHKAGRPAKTSPVHERLAARGAVFAARNGWECPLMAAAAPPAAAGASPYARPPWFDQVGAECRAVHQGAGILDLTATAKFDVSGPGAEAFLDTLLATPLPADEGAVADSLMLNPEGGIEGRLTVTRLARDRFALCAPAVAEVHHLDWLRRHCPDDGVAIDCISEDCGVFLIAGPRAPAVLAGLTGAEAPGEAFPMMTARPAELEFATIRLIGVDAWGETGWELHHPIEHQAALYDALVAGTEPIADFGLRAAESLRLEVGQAGWKSELALTTTPAEAGLDGLIDFDKGDFIGRAALGKGAGSGARRRLAGLVVEIGESGAWIWGNEAVLSDDRAVALTLSAGYGHRVGKSIALAFLPVELSEPGTALEVEVLGQRLAARVVRMPLYVRA